MTASITFLGGVGTVTGSKFLVRSGQSRILVDCGLFQGLAPLRRRNWQPPAIALEELDAVVLTHAHLDHCGYLPVLVRAGWRGPVYATDGTAKLVSIVLADSAHLMVEEAAHANTYGWSKHEPALPLYDELDAARAVGQLSTVEYGVVKEVAGGIELELGRAGHILGSSWAKLRLGGERTVVVLIELARLVKAGAIPDLPVLVDSPMALSALRVYRQALTEHWSEVRTDLPEVDDPFDPGHLAELRTVEESMTANRPRQPSIIVSASGMATGGRILHHLEHLLPDRRNTVVIVGFAAAGTRARDLATGARQIKIHGRYTGVRVEVVVLDAFSAHADASELIDWATAGPPPQSTYLVHGEPDGSSALAARLGDEFSWNAVVPRDGEQVLV